MQVITKSYLLSIGFKSIDNRIQQITGEALIRFVYGSTLKPTYIKSGSNKFILGGFKTYKGTKNVWHIYNFDKLDILQFNEFVKNTHIEVDNSEYKDKVTD